MAPVRIVKHHFENQLIVFTGENGTQLAMPILALLPAAASGRRILSAVRLSGGPQPDPDEWTFVAPTPAQSFRVHTMPTDTGVACVLLIDPGTESELQLSVQNSEHVRQLGEALIEVSEQMTSKPSSLS